MAEKFNVKWSREETIVAYDLYCRIAFSKISKTNKDVIALAEILGRTPSSVGLKMANLAHYDPALKEKNIKGMANASKLDKEVVEEFYNDWTSLSYLAKEILANYKHVSVEDLITDIHINGLPSGIDIERSIKTRVGQQFFRSTILTAYNNACCITGIRQQELLIASHIKPWRDSNEKTERTNPMNGLCLNALHDKAFDRGLITIDKNYRIILSKRLKDVYMDENTRNWFNSYENQKITMPDKFIPGREFIEYHNDMIFQG
ncbi:MAG: HNH endonuclease [Lachnospiraceae bacterium]|nr:HNH endonuclease [Lachnospiraceae bacterium]